MRSAHAHIGGLTNVQRLKYGVIVYNVFLLEEYVNRLHLRSTQWRCGRWRPDLARGRDERTGV